MHPFGSTFLALALAAPLAWAQPCSGPAITRLGPNSQSQIWPRGVQSPNAVYDTVDRRILLIGTSAAGDTTEIWEFDGFSWGLIIPSDGTTPPPLTGAAAVYHQATGRVLFFGGTLPSGADSNRTYLFNGLYWDEPFFQDTPPLPLHDAALIYVPSLDRALLFGGIRDNHSVDETWTWGMGGWVADTRTPHPVGGSLRNTTVYRPARQSVIFADPRINDSELSGVWQYSASGWAQQTMVPAPAAGLLVQPPILHEPQSGQIVRLSGGGVDARTQRWIMGEDETWYFDRYLEPSLPYPLFDLTTATDVYNKKELIFGRTTPQGDLELWEYDLTPGTVQVSIPRISYGLNANISVLASGIEPLSYQWLRDGQPIDDDAVFEAAQSPSMAIAAGSLRCTTFELSCRVCGPCGCSTSIAVRFEFNFVGDFNIDGGTDGQDVEAFILAWEAAEPGADVNCDGGIDGGDVEAFFTCWEAGCP